MLVCAIPGTNLGENGEGVKGLHGVGMDWGILSSKLSVNKGFWTQCHTCQENERSLGR